MVNISLLGSGFVAELYLRALAHVPEARVRINYSRDMARARRLGRAWGISESTDDLSAAIRHPDVDLVAILLPNFLHRPAALAAAKAGKAVICEKPLGRDGREARDMLRAVERARVFHGYAESEVFMPAVVKAHEIAAGGALGRVVSFRAHGAHSGPHAAWFWDRRLSGGGALLDMGCHAVESARCVFGKNDRAVQVFGRGDTLVHRAKTKAEDDATALIRFSSGGVAEVHAAWTARGGLDVRSEIYGRDGAVFIDAARGAPVRSYSLKGSGYSVEKAETDRGWQFAVPEEHVAFGYANELRHFVECLRAGRKPRETFADGLAVNLILDAAYRSMRTGRWERPAAA